MDKKNKLHSELKDIEQKMTKLFEMCPTHIFTPIDLSLLSSLKKRKERILEIEEATWRLRSREYGLRKGIETPNPSPDFLCTEGARILSRIFHMKLVALNQLIKRLV